MSLAGDSLTVHNRRPERVAAQITQDPDSTLPALAVGGDLLVTGAVTTGGVKSSGTAATGQVQAATSATASTWMSAVNVGSWVFDVRTYGAVGDGQAATDGSITSGLNVLTCATSKPFKPADVGKWVMVKGALSSGATTLVTRITGYISPSTVTLGANATNTMSGNALVMWATDDTAALQRAINAAFAYGQINGTAIVWVPPIGSGLFYGVAGPLVAGGATKANGQLVIPIQATTSGKVALIIMGATDGGATRHWEQKIPQLSGSTLVSFGVAARSCTAGRACARSVTMATAATASGRRTASSSTRSASRAATTSWSSSAPDKAAWVR